MKRHFSNKDREKEENINKDQSDRHTDGQSDRDIQKHG